MYLYHFGLRELPFTLTPNTNFFLGLPSYNQALETLLTALMAGEGFIKLVGEVGLGKTLLCRKLLKELPNHFATAYIPNPYLKPDELRWAVASELGVELNADVNQQQLTELIHQRLMQLHQQGHSVVLILDEAQAIPEESLEALRLFTNLETENRKLLQVVMFGQPELDARLKQDHLRQLRQRITFSYELKALSEKEVGEYIQHRLNKAGALNADLFNTTHCRKIARASRGIPRVINILCHKSLLLCYGQGRQEVNRKDLSLAIKDTQDAHGIKWLSWLPLGICVMLSMSAGYWMV